MSFLRFLLVGDPVEHSRSPVMQREAMRRAGLEGEYDVFRTDGAALAEVVERLRQGELAGVNVTMPLKEAAFRLCEDLTAEAAAAGSVNTLRTRSGRVEGHSTDTVAFIDIFSAVGLDVPIHILGAGGSARAAVAAWDGPRPLVSARRPDQAASLGAVDIVPWGSAVPGAVLVNATPIGMAGDPLPEGLVVSCSLLVDLPYGSEPTPATRAATARGTPVVDGIEFLAMQAAASFRWWTGVDLHWPDLVRAARNG